MQKRILSYVLTLVMLLSLVPTTALAVEETAKAPVNVVLVDGQSNAAGSAGTMNGADGTVGTIDLPAEGTAYLWNGEGLTDMNAKYASHTSTKSVGFHPAMAKALTEKTGIPTVVIHQGHSGEAISRWAAQHTASGVAAVEDCLEYLADNGYEVVNSGYVWLQGESDACINKVAEYTTYTDLETYYNALKAIHTAYTSALGEGSIGGIITVQTRQQLLSGPSKASEYIGVRAAQQAAANKWDDMVIVSDITDDWRYNVAAEKQYFSGSGGPIHYSQIGYNAIGADVGANLAKAWDGAAITGIEVVGFDGATVYENGATIPLADNLHVIGTENTAEEGNAQLAIKTYPVYAEGAVSVTVTDAEGKDMGINESGRILNADEITGDLTMTVKSGDIEQTYTLAGAKVVTSTAPLDFDYEWDFTDTALVNGKVLTAVKGGNDLTYQGANDIVLTADGMNNSHTSNGRMYFLMDEAITLPSTSPWTITWQGGMGAASVPVSYTEDGTVDSCKEFIFASTDTDSANAMWFRAAGNSTKATLKGYANEVKNDSNTIWYAIHDGNGTMTLAATAADGTVYLKSVTENAIKQDYTYDTVLGYFSKSSTSFNYYSTIKNLRIYSEAYELPTEDTAITGSQTVSLTAPKAGMVPETSVSGTGYTGTVVWTPSADKFAGNTVYTAAVTLTAADGYVFNASATAAVTGATVSEVAVAEDGSTLTFKAAFPATEEVTFNEATTDDFYWDFTTAAIDGNEVSSVTGDGWVKNTLTFNGNSFSRTAADGVRGSSNRAEYFAMEYPASLPKNDEWTIEWGGKVSSGSIMFSDNNLETGTLPANSQHQHLWYDGDGVMHLRDKSGTDAGYLTLNTSAYSGKDAVWYVINDHGTLTLAACYNGEWLTATKANGITQDYEVDSLFGIYSSGAGYDLQGSVKYMKIYHEAAIVDGETITAAEAAVTAPKTFGTPVTTVTGENFTGTIQWDGALAADGTYQGGTVYTAEITLTAADGYLFDAATEFTVPGATLGSVVTFSKNNGTATISAKFPATKVVDTESDFYWDFTDPANQSGNTTVYSESGDGWTENTLTYIDHSQAGNNLKLTANGFSNNGGGYFEMDKSIYLPTDESWTIEWKGNTKWSSVLMANNDSDSVDEQGHKTSEYIYIYNNDKTNTPEANYITIANSGTAGNNQKAAGFGPIATTARENPDSVWYLKNTNEGDLFLEYRSGDSTEELYINANTDIGRKNYTFDSLLGYFTERSPIYYASYIQYLKVYRDEVVNTHELNLEVPKAVPAATSFSTNAFTASINWDDLATFATTSTVNRVANITLTAAEGYRFSDLATFSIPGASSTEVLSISEDGKTAEVAAVFAVEVTTDTDSYYWDFTNGAVSVTGDGWTENKLTSRTLAGRTFYDMASEVILPQDAPWTIEWKGTSPSSCVVLANNDDTRDTSTKGAEYIYVANNSGAADSTELFFVKKEGATSTNIKLSNIPDAVKNAADATWYISHNGEGDVTLAVYGAGQLVEKTLNDVINRDYSYNAIKGYYTTGTPIGYGGTLKSMKIYRTEAQLPVAVMDNTPYFSINDAIAAAPVDTYANGKAGADAQLASIKLLRDAVGGFDVGVETGSLATFGIQNIAIDLNGKTLTLGQPLVGSAGTKTSGIRVLAYSDLAISNGTISGLDSDALRGIQNYGDVTVEDVTFANMGETYDTIGNFGALKLAGEVVVPNGTNSAILNSTYTYPDDSQVPVNLNIQSEDVTVGKVVVDLNETAHSTTGAINAADPIITISAGSFESIATEGEDKTIDGGVKGGTFENPVPKSVCVKDFVPTQNADGTYGVREAEYKVKMTVNGVDSYYESINEAIDAAPTASYAEGKAGNAADLAVITLLDDTVGGFDVGVETGSLSTWKIQNIEIDLNGYTLTLGQPLVGSTGTVTNGIRVLAYSKLSLSNGTVSGLDSDALRGLQNYGAVVVEDVTFADMGETYDTIGNFGALELKGEVVVPNGTNSAILNSTYLYSDDSQVPVTLKVEENSVWTGKVVVDLGEYKHPQTGDVNESAPVLLISGGTFESIAATGEDKEIDGGVKGGTFSAPVPAELCADTYAPVENADGTYGVDIHYVAEMNGEKYTSINAAVAAAPKGLYPTAPSETTTIKLLDDAVGGFDIGVETGSLATFGTQNIAIDLDGYTLTLGQPLVGSTGTKTNGIRVLAYSKLSLSNGTVSGLDSEALRGLQNYGAVVVEDVTFADMGETYDTIGNFGSLELKGDVVVPNGTNSAILNSTYTYPDDSQVPVILTVTESSVKVGKVVIDLDETAHPTTGAVNAAAPKLYISDGTFESIATTGEDKTVEGGIKGGTFQSAVPAELCGNGFVPTKNADGTYGVREAEYKVKMTVNGVDTYYETINEAIAAAPTASYATGKNGGEAEFALIKLLDDAVGGFDIGVETGSLSTWKIQNIEIDLNGKTLTLGQPLVGSTGTKTSGIRVLAYSKFVIGNGTIDGLDSGALRGIQNYGDTAVCDVVFENMDEAYDTIGNFGYLNVAGETVVPNGTNSAILNSSYLYSDDSQVPVTLSIEDEAVTVGKVIIDLGEYTHPQTGDVNTSAPVLNISAGTFESIETENADKTIEGGVEGGIFQNAVPSTVVAEGFVPAKNADGTYGVKVGEYAVEMNGQKYASINEAVAAAETGIYPVAPAETTSIKLLRDTVGGFDIGVETGSLATFGTQNIAIDLNGYTLTLGEPLVGSAGTVTNGIRVLAYSKLSLSNGTVSGLDSDALRGLQNYGAVVVEDVTFADMGETYDTIGNFGALELKGEVVVPNGTNSAILNSTYTYPDDSQVPVSLNIQSEDVTVGKVVIDLDETAHPTTGAINAADPIITISAGSFESIETTGEDKEIEGGVKGGTFEAPVPENVCAENYAPVANPDGTYGVDVHYVVEMNGVKYVSINAAVATAAKGAYPATPDEAVTITLLDDVTGGFDIGVETGSLATFKTQNIVLDLDGHTLTLGHPPVGSSSVLKTNGLRVLAFSELEIVDGTIAVDNDSVRVAIANYGKLTLTDVEVGTDDGVLYTINNRGDLTLDGETSVVNGGAENGIAITNQPYNYPDDQDINAKLNVSSKDVTVGDVQVELSEVEQGQTGATNDGVPEINISAGTFGEIFTDGETAKTPVGNITGGTFTAAVPAELCADGYVPAENADGTYGVREAEYKVKMTVDGVDTYYETINEAIADAPTAPYADGKDGKKAKFALITLLDDVTGGFDVGVETGSLATFRIQNISINLNGKTLTLGQPLVGSTGTKTSGIRVLAYSQLNIENGKISGLDSGALRGLQNYGDTVVEDVLFVDMEDTYDTIGNFGSVELLGDTAVPNGTNSAILNSSYLYSDDSQVPVTLTVEEDTVVVGKVVVDLNEYTHPTTGDVNEAAPVLEISGGNFESIESTGEDKTIEGGISGGTFYNPVPADLCAEGYAPVKLGENKYGVEIDYAVKMTVDGVDTYYMSINGAIADAPTISYADGKAGKKAEMATITLLDDVTGGFDVGVETGSLATWLCQNIDIQLEGHTLTLGQPLVGSTGTKTSGIRVLAYSRLTISGGKVVGDGTGALRGLQNYGYSVVEDVIFDEIGYDTIGNFGTLWLQGDTVVPNGSDSAILNSSYLYSDDSQNSVRLIVEEDTVKVGKVVVDLNEYTHTQTGTTNKAAPILEISAGNFESIETIGEGKTIKVGVSGGTFEAPVPAELCAEGFVPTQNTDGTYGVKPEAAFAIETQPQNVTAEDGETAIFTVVATGEDLTYQWEFRTDADSKWDYSPAEGAKTATLKVPATTWRNGYQYRCVVKSGSETLISEVVTLTVTDAFAIETEPQDVTAESGEIATFTVVATGKDLTYQWEFRTDADSKWDYSPAEGAKTATLKVPATTWRNGYQYRCVVKSGSETLISKVVTLTVADVFAIKTDPQDVTGVNGKTVTFTVVATGADLTYQWEFRADADSKWDYSPAEGAKTATLKVPVTTWRDGYQYRCVVTNGDGRVLISEAATLTLAGGPKIVEDPEDATVSGGTNATFTVVARGDGLTYQWQFRESANGAWDNSPANGNRTDTLSIPATSWRNGYQYRCKVTDKYGMVSYTDVATLTVVTGAVIEKQPADVNAVVGDDNATFRVVASGTGLTYQWQFRESARGLWDNSPAAGAKTATLTVPVTLWRNGYQYRCRITDGSGNEVFTDAATLTVIESKVEITSQPDDVTVGIGGTAEFSVEAEGTGLTYQWQFRESARGAWDHSPADGAKTATLRIPGVLWRDGYQYRCVVTDANGKTATSEIATLTVSDEPVITSQPRSKTVSAGDEAVFTVEADGEDLTYQWQFCEAGSSVWEDSPADGNDTDTLIVSGVAWRNGYQYRCIVTDADGDTVTTRAATLTVK